MQNGNGQVIGTLISEDYGFSQITVMTLDGYLFKTGGAGYDFGYLGHARTSGPWYKTPDCSGQAYTAGYNDTFRNYPGILSLQGKGLFVREWGGEPTPAQTMQSYYDDGECIAHESERFSDPIREVDPHDYGLELDEDGRLHFPMPIKPAVAR
ncbi:unnamed protein product [marine sediment metagenome]|uniref:Uncharacterized protein n=1 Tax=marine sediment metagenome TaxID=412755 RepID=X1AI25_9ZZZZ